MLASQMVAVNGELQLGILRVGNNAACIDIKGVGRVQYSFTDRTLRQYANHAIAREFHFYNVPCNEHILHA
ncbi:hypothetical protein D3C76_1467190 [compost metagenome]